MIAPLFDGGGMKSKTVEALSFGKIFVGTEESLFGFWEERVVVSEKRLVISVTHRKNGFRLLTIWQMMIFTNLMKMSLNFLEQSSLMMSLEIR